MKTYARAWNSSGGFFDVAAKREELARIEASASAPDFWNDQEQAQQLLQRRSRVERVVNRQERFASSIEDAQVLVEFAEDDEESLRELRSLLERLEAEVSASETEMLLAGEHDRRNATCTIHAGTRGTESHDCVEMRMRMSLRSAERRCLKAEILDYQPSEEAAIKGVRLRV